MKRYWILFPVLAAVLGFAGWRLQQAAQTPYVFHANVGEVLVHATVYDKHHKTVETLPQSDFTVFENGVQQKVDFFSREDAPVSVGIVVDNSGSMRDKRDQVNKAALNFVRASNPGDEVFIVNFNEEYYLDAEFTNDINKMQLGLEQIESRGGTALYDAVIASLDYLNQNAKKDKRVILLITDGDDDASRYSLEQAVRIAQSDNPPLIYSIGLIDSMEDKGKVQRALKALSEATGGVAYFPKDLSEVDSITQEVAADIRKQYSFAYRSNQTGTGYRTIRVEVRDPKQKDLTVRSRTGYYHNPNGAPDPGGS